MSSNEIDITIMNYNTMYFPYGQLSKYVKYGFSDCESLYTRFTCYTSSHSSRDQIHLSVYKQDASIGPFSSSFSTDLYFNFLGLTLPVNTIIKTYHHVIIGIFTLNLHNLYSYILMYIILNLQVVCALKEIKVPMAPEKVFVYKIQVNPIHTILKYDNLL